MTWPTFWRLNHVDSSIFWINGFGESKLPNLCGLEEIGGSSSKISFAAWVELSPFLVCSCWLPGGWCWFIRHSTGAFWSHGLRCIYGICIPVNFDDPGSLIAHALLSDRAQEQMAAQWRLLPGGKPCCPLGTSCLRSLAKVLSQRTSKLGDRSVSERANQLVPNAPNLSRKELHAKTSKLLKPLSSLSVPGELPGHAQAAADWEGQGLREVLTGATFKEVKVPEMVGMCWDRVTSRVVSSRTFLSFVWWRL